MEQLSLEPQLLNLCAQLLKPASRAYAPQQEKPQQWEAHALQPEKAHVKTTPGAARNKNKENSIPRRYLISPIHHSSPLFFFNILATLHSMWDVNSQTRDQTCDPCIGSRISTTRPPGKFPQLVFYTDLQIWSRCLGWGGHVVLSFIADVSWHGTEQIGPKETCIWMPASSSLDVPFKVGQTTLLK